MTTATTTERRSGTTTLPTTTARKTTTMIPPRTGRSSSRSRAANPRQQRRRLHQSTKKRRLCQKWTHRASWRAGRPSVPVHALRLAHRRVLARDRDPPRRRASPAAAPWPRRTLLRPLAHTTMPYLPNHRPHMHMHRLLRVLLLPPNPAATTVPALPARPPTPRSPPARESPAPTASRP